MLGKDLCKDGVARLCHAQIKAGLYLQVKLSLLDRVTPLCKSRGVFSQESSTSMSLGARIRKARTDARLMQARIAESCRKTLQTVSGWERDLYQPSTEDLTTISVLTGVNPGWLLSGHASASIAGDKAWRGRVVPSLEWSHIAGYLDGAFTADMNARSHHPCGPRSFQTFVDDRSNEPELAVGDGIIVDPDIKPTPGDLVVIAHENAFLIRRFRPRADHVELAPSNPDWPALMVPALDPTRLVGVVSEISKPRRR